MFDRFEESFPFRIQACRRLIANHFRPNNATLIKLHELFKAELLPPPNSSYRSRDHPRHRLFCIGIKSVWQVNYRSYLIEYFQLNLPSLNYKHVLRWLTNRIYSLTWRIRDF